MKRILFLLLILWCSQLMAQSSYVNDKGDTLTISYKDTTTTALRLVEGVKDSVIKVRTYSYKTEATTFSIPKISVKLYVKPPVVVTPPVIVDPVVVRNNLTFEILSDPSKFDRSCAGAGNSIGVETIGGKKALKFTVVKGSEECAGGLRSELSNLIDTKAVYPYEVWYGLSYYVGADWVTDQPNLFDIVNQWHDDGAVLKSPFDFSINGSQWRYQVRSTTIGEKGFDFAPVEKETWTDFVFHLKFVRTGKGIVQIWKNGILLVDKQIEMGYNKTTVPFFKAGIYKWPWNKQDMACCGNTYSTTHSIYIANIRLGNKSATYNDVKP